MVVPKSIQHHGTWDEGNRYATRHGMKSIQDKKRSLDLASRMKHFQVPWWEVPCRKLGQTSLALCEGGVNNPESQWSGSNNWFLCRCRIMQNQKHQDMALRPKALEPQNMESQLQITLYCLCWKIPLVCFVMPDQDIPFIVPISDTKNNQLELEQQNRAMQLARYHAN